MDVTFEDISGYKNADVISTTSNCFARKNHHQIILDFGLFLISKHLNEDNVQLFSLPETLRPKIPVYFSIASTGGDVCGSCSVDADGAIKIVRTPSVEKYFVGQVIYFVGK